MSNTSETYVRSEAERGETAHGTLRVDYHCHISMMEYADPEHPTVVSVSRDEFLSDLDEAGFDMAVVLSDSRTKVSVK